MTNVLVLVQDSADELSLARPTDISDTSDDNTAQKLVRHLTRTCRLLASSYDWTRLRREKTLVTTATETQTGAIPSDFARFVQGTLWNRTRRAVVNGPLPPDDWQTRKAVLVNGSFGNFCIRGTSFLMTPVPPAGQTIAYEYITNYIAVNASGTTEMTTYTADDDQPYFDDELIILGTVWRYRKAEGLDYAEEFRQFEMRRADMIKMDGGRRRLNMNGDKLDRPINTTYTEIADIFTV